MSQFTRRQFLIASGAMLAPRLAHGQAHARKVGILASDRLPATGALLAKLKQLGWVERQNLLVVTAYADLNLDRLPSLAEDLVRQRVDVIVAFGEEAALPAARATATIPIVFGFVGWPVEMGLIESFAKPGRNATGVAAYTGMDVSIKRHEFLREIAPAAKRLSWISQPAHNQDVRGAALDLKVDEAVKQLGYEPQFHVVRKTEDLEGVFSELVAFRAQALSVGGSVLLHHARQRIADFARHPGNRVTRVSARTVQRVARRNHLRTQSANSATG
jgi:putative ABC transport system substrate-binding protein